MMLLRNSTLANLLYNLLGYNVKFYSQRIIDLENFESTLKLSLPFIFDICKLYSIFGSNSNPQNPLSAFENFLSYFNKVKSLLNRTYKYKYLGICILNHIKRWFF